MDSEPGPDQAPPRRHEVAVVGAFAIAIAVLAASAYVLGAVGTASSPASRTAASPSARYFAFVCPLSAPGAPPADCARLARDAVRRPQLSGAQRAAGEQVATHVRAALAATWLSSGQAGCPLPTAVGHEPEPCRYAPAAPTGDDVDRARRALAAAGFSGATVRLAGADDPAPAGALLYAVPAGDVCVLGYEQDSNGPGYGSPLVVGPLPDGECLAN